MERKDEIGIGGLGLLPSPRGDGSLGAALVFAVEHHLEDFVFNYSKKATKIDALRWALWETAGKFTKRQFQTTLQGNRGDTIDDYVQRLHGDKTMPHDQWDLRLVLRWMQSEFDFKGNIIYYCPSSEDGNDGKLVQIKMEGPDEEVSSDDVNVQKDMVLVRDFYGVPWLNTIRFSLGSANGK